MGAVVVKNVDDGVTVIGNPAKPIIKKQCINIKTNGGQVSE